MAVTGTRQEIRLADGTLCRVRDLAETDGAGVSQLDRATLGDRPLQGEDADGAVPTADDRAFWAREVAADPHWVVLLADSADGIMGLLEFRAYASPLATRHVGRFYLSVHPSARRKGIARALTETLFTWVAEQDAIRKISISAIAGNLPAIRLYESFGFTVEGVRRREFRMPDGSYEDEVLFAWLKEP